MFYNESWFWALPFTTAVTVVTPILNYIFTHRSQVELERIRMYEKEIIEAHKALYRFISNAYGLLLPDEDDSGFTLLMKNDYYKNIKPQMLFFSKEIRDILAKFEAHHIGIINPDLVPEITHSDFIWKHLENDLQTLSRLVENLIDNLLRSPKKFSLFPRKNQ